MPPSLCRPTPYGLGLNIPQLTCINPAGALAETVVRPLVAVFLLRLHPGLTGIGLLFGALDLV